MRQAVSVIPGVGSVTLHMIAMTPAERKEVFGEPKEGSSIPYNRIKRIVTIMSGKG